MAEHPAAREQREVGDLAVWSVSSAKPGEEDSFGFIRSVCVRVWLDETSGCEVERGPAVAAAPYLSALRASPHAFPQIHKLPC
jgi:hypothetical protein